MRKKSNENCVLATDFSIVDRDMKVWQQQREKKENIYYAFNEYILCLEDSLKYEEDSYKRYLIEKKLKKLKKEQKKYYVPSVLESCRLDSYSYNDNLYAKKKIKSIKK